MSVYIEDNFKPENTSEYKTVEAKINEDLIPSGVHKFLTTRYGKLDSLSFHFTREAND